MNTPIHQKFSRVATAAVVLNPNFAKVRVPNQAKPVCRVFLTRLRQGVWLSLAAACALLASGCATHQPIPKTYLDQSKHARLVIQKVPPAPTMADSGQGGLVGAIITGTSRANNMKEKLAGIHGDQVQEAFTQAFQKSMGEHLVVGDSDGELRIVVNIDTWGWYVPTIDFGIKVGDYECQVVGRVDVFDTQDKKVAFAHLRVAEPLGSKPEEDNARKAVTQVAERFAAAAETALVHLPKGR
jgi:hypothetical protein